MLKISIQEAEIRQKKTKRQKLQLELFPNEEQNIDYYGISLWIKRNLEWLILNNSPFSNSI